MILSKHFLVLLSSLLCSQKIDASRSHLRRANIRHASDNGELNCRVTIKETTFDDGNGGIQDEDDVVCIKQVDDEDSSMILSLADIPHHVYEVNEKEISLGRLYMTLTGVSVDSGNVIMSEETEFTVLADSGSRKLEEELTFGTKTLAVVRISTRDARVTATASELRKTVLAEGPHVSNLMSQFREMSFGQLTFKPKGVYEIYIDQSISLFTGLNISEAAETAMVEQLGLEKASDLADRVLFCVPPGLKKGFIAFTYRNYWRATFSDKFCHSMSATIHEIGHTIGLGHSHWDEPNDYQDVSCYMGGSGGNAHAPRQTFNAHKGWQTGWYASRHLAFDPFSDEARRVNVAALVDFEMSSDEHVVIVNIADHVYFQYNRAKGFNNETRAMPNKLVVVESHGNGNSGRIAALGPADGAFEIPNFKESGWPLVIQVCREQFGDAKKPDLMVVSIGFGESTCSTWEEEVTVTSPPSSSPSSAPIGILTYSPSHSPSQEPTKTPTKTPSSMPSTTPSSAPSRSPSNAPSPSPSMSVFPSTAPSSRPTAFPSSTPTLEPSSTPSFQPTMLPTATPSSSHIPSSSPSLKPSAQPSVSSKPSLVPSSQPSQTPSDSPSVQPSISSAPSQSPSILPSNIPSVSPSRSPSSRPSTAPSVSPSFRPAASTTSPSLQPSGFPSLLPSQSLKPSTAPSLFPSQQPTLSPTSNAPTPSPNTILGSIPTSQPPSSFSPTPQPSKKPSSRRKQAFTPSPSGAPVFRADEILKLFFGDY